MSGVSLPRPILLIVVVGLGLCGGAVLLWFSGGDGPNTWDEAIRWNAPIQVVSGAGERGPWRMNESDWDFVDDPTVAMGGDETTWVAWTDHTAQDLRLQRYGPKGQPQFDTPTDISQTPDTFSWLPRMVVSDDDPAIVYVLWQEIIFSGGTHGGDILFARSTDGGRSFTRPENLSQSPAGDGKGRLTTKHWHNGSLDLAVGPGGTIYAAWTEYEGRLWVARSTNRGRSFSTPVHVHGTQDRPARGPALAVDGSGQVHLAWTVGNTPTADIQYTHSPDTTLAFDRPRAIDESSGYSDAPKLAASPDGTIHVAYGERPVDGDTAPHIRYTQRSDGDEFAPPVVLSRRHADAYRGAQFPYLRVPSAEAVVIAWELISSAQRRPSALGYTTSQNGGATFGRPTVLPGTDTTVGINGSQQGFLMEKLDVRSTGTLAVVNSTFRRDEGSHVWLYTGELRER